MKHPKEVAMRYFAPLLIGLAVSSCTAAPPSAETSAFAARQQARLAALTAGKIAGPALSCLPSYRRNDMIVIEYGNNALVTRTTSTQLCRGDIAEVLDTAARIPIGGCVFGDFVPYTTAGSRY
jgi:hypothetical protein